MWYFILECRKSQLVFPGGLLRPSPSSIRINSLDYIELGINEGVFNITKKASKSGKGQKFKFDMTKDGKLDVSFVRFDCSEKKMKRKIALIIIL